jgi:hypothetical protein
MHHAVPVPNALSDPHNFLLASSVLEQIRCISLFYTLCIENCCLNTNKECNFLTLLR